MRIHRLIAGLALAAAVPALAQTAAPAAPVAAEPPKHTCTKPGDFPSKAAGESTQRAFQRDYVTYTDCLKKFALEQQALAEPHMKASTATITEYNAAVKAYNDEVEKNNKAGK